MAKAQTSVEYILLLTFGLFIVIVGFTLAMYVKTFTDSALGLVAVSRNETLGLLLK